MPAMTRKTPLSFMMQEDKLKVCDMERLTGISYRRFSDYLANRKDYSPNHLDAIADVLGCDPDDLRVFGMNDDELADYMERTYG